MTTKEKLIELNFFKDNKEYSKVLLVDKSHIILRYNTYTKNGYIQNAGISNAKMKIDNFEQLLRWNDFYEKQASKFTARDESRVSGTTQDNAEKYVKINDNRRV